MELNLLQITAENPLIITTEKGLEQVMARMLNRLGFEANTPSMPAIIATEVTTRLAKKMLKEKGYRVSSNVAFKKVITDHNITPERKGKDDWYQVSDLQRVPARL